MLGQMIKEIEKSLAQKQWSSATTIVNSFILYGKDRKDAASKPLSNLTFRSNLVNQLIGTFTSRKKVGYASGKSRARKRNSPFGKPTVENSLRLTNLEMMSPTLHTISKNYDILCMRSAPNCARCRNHGILQTLKGHKRYCKFIKCTCKKCKLTMERQKVMAHSTAVRRAEEQDRERMRKGLPTLKKLPSPQQDCTNDIKVSNSSSDSLPDNASSTTVTKDVPTLNISKKSKSLWESILFLLELCKLPSTTSPLLHIILTRITSDPMEVYNFFKEAEEELKAKCALKDEFQQTATIVEHLNPWALYYSFAVPPAASLPTALHDQHPGHPNPSISSHGVTSFRYHPYPVLPTYKNDFFQNIDHFGYSLPLRSNIISSDSVQQDVDKKVFYES
ncbi:hypothetical protein J6590_019159 [Homalodisca vitripennis]|nr:hypothetical protein J6590_019159 [Homalodisca vitripennis]